MREVNRIVIHHSASPLTTTLSELVSWHAASGFDPAPGYHGVITADGRFHPTARRFPRQGAHAKGANADSYGLCLIGDNTVDGRKWNREQIEMARRVVAALRGLMPWLEVYGHREVGTTATECPGMEGDELRALLLAGSPEPDLLRA